MRKFIYRNKIIQFLVAGLILSCRADLSNIANQQPDNGPIECPAISLVQDHLKLTGLVDSQFYRVWIGDYVIWNNCNPELDHTSNSSYHELTGSEVFLTTYIPEKTQIILASYNSNSCNSAPIVLLRTKIDIRTQELEQKINGCFYGVPKYFEFDVTPQIIGID